MSISSQILFRTTNPIFPKSFCKADRLVDSIWEYTIQDGFALMIQLGRVLGWWGGVGWLG